MTEHDLICRSALGIGKAKRECFEDPKYADGWNSAVEIIENAPAVDAVSRLVVEHIKWERDTAIQQLKDHGIPFGGTAPDVVEVVRCKDCKMCMLWRKPTDTVIGDCRIRKMNSEDEEFCMVGAYDFCSYGERRTDE